MNDIDAANLERADRLRKALHREMLMAKPADGLPFGLPDSDRNQSGVFILRVHKGAATLYRIQPDGISDQLAHAPEMFWPSIAGPVAADFNLRMARVGKPAGSWPEEGGTTRLHPALGRELQVAMLVATESFQDGPRNLRIWMETDPTKRLAQFKRWQNVCNADASQTVGDLLFVVLNDAASIRRMQTEMEFHRKALYRYVVDRDPLAPADIFNINTLPSDLQHKVRTAAANAFNWLSPEARLERTQMVKAAIAERAALEESWQELQEELDREFELATL